MEHRVAAWESMPWEAVEAVAVPSVEKGRATCAASLGQMRLRFGRCNPQKGFPPSRRISPRYRSLAPIPPPGSPLE